MPLVTGGVAFAWWRGWLDRRVWVIVLLLQAALAGSGLVAMNTGETEEERVEEIVPERYIESHEEAAEAFVWASAIVLALMLLPLVLPQGRLRTAAAVGACLGTLLVFGLGYRTGEAGGRLVYEHGAAQAYVGPGAVLPGDVIRSDERADDDSDD
jgi:putative copper export protein